MSAEAPAQDGATDTQDPYRVLVVEDDRSQAIFAEAILRGAGMLAEVVSEPSQMMATLQRVRPDVVLMDLHLPGIRGTELTAGIRATPGFEDTPVVFLSGDTDPDRKVEALEHGGDDYLIKPVRPRHLIAAIQNRARRARALAARRHPQGAEARQGLHGRDALKRLLDAPLARGYGGALLVEIDNAAALRERYGFADFEAMMDAVHRRLADAPGERAVAPLGEHAFLVVLDAADPGVLQDQARVLRDRIGQEAFRADGESVRLRGVVGHASLDQGFTDASAVLAALEEATRAARASMVGVAAYAPPDVGAASDLAAALASSLSTDDGRLHLTFQPVVAVDGGNEAQFQVLARMRDADGQVLRARDFLPVARAAGLLADLDRWVLRTSLALLHRRRGENRPMRLFLSQSSRTLAQDDFAASLLAALDAAGVPGDALVIDIRLEDALVHGLLLQQACPQLHAAGVRFCLSQFRKGEDADALLHRLPLSYARLDVAFAVNALDDAMREELARIVEGAHALGIQVIGQAVEDPQAAAALWTGGVDFLQGNLVHEAEQALDYDFRSGAL